MKTHTDDLFETIFVHLKQIILNYSGIFLKNEKKEKILKKVNDRMQILNMHNINNYYRYLLDNKIELQELINSITNVSTYFFRENHHFIYLKNHILPILLSKKK